jgi:DNA-binding transcriptional MerR regulator
VRRDVASGVLPSLKLPNGRRRFRKADVERYRQSHTLQKPYMKLEEFAHLVGVSLRTLRRWMANGKLSLPIIRASRRRHFLSRAFVRTGACLNCLERKPVMRERYKDQWPRPLHRRDTRPRPFFLLVVEVAALAGRTRRQVYHDIEKGALPVSQSRRRCRILVQIDEAEVYAGRRLLGRTMTNGVT